MRRLVFSFLAIIGLSLAVAASTGGDLPRPAQSVQASRSVVDELSPPRADPYVQLARAQGTAEYGQAIQRDEVGQYLAAKAVGEYLASIPAPAPIQPSEPAVRSAQGAPSLVSGPCGGATNGADQFIGRESGGDPNARNPSGAWGCFQIMPGTWAGAGCNELGSHGSASAEAQAACASRLPLSAWNL